MNFVDSTPLQHFSYPVVITAMEDNLISYINYCSGIAGARTLSMPHHIAAITGIAQPALNAITHVRFTAAQVEQQISSALEPFRAQQLPMLWWLFPGTQPHNLGEALTEQGMQYIGATPGMIIRLADLPTATAIRHPPQMSIEEVCDEKTLHEWIRTSALAFDEEAAEVDPEYIIFERNLGWGSQRPYRRFLGRIAGEPVATAALFIGAGVIGLYSVGTLPAMRHQGIASMLSLTALQAAGTQHYRFGILQTTEQGFDMYYRLGFRECCRIQNYIWTPYPTSH
jgi:Acetyltransferases